MLHVLSYRTDIVTLILCGVKFGVLHQDKNTDLGFVGAEW